jgi:heme exporter protein A
VVIRVRNLEKRYGRKRVFEDVSFDVASGGFLVVKGANGSGKTTLLRLVAGLAAPTRGTVVVDVDRSRIGLLAHEPLVYRELTALENLDLFGRLYRVPERRERIGMLLERFGLWDSRNERVTAYSRGMTQRLALCRTLLHEPDVLVLD